MGKKLMVVVAICAAFVVAAGTASANTPSITYTGQGMDANGPTTQNCGAAADDGGTGLGIPASGQYLLWVLNGVDSSVTSVSLHLPDGEHPMVKVGNTWKYVSNVFTRADLIAFPAHAGWDGIQAANNLVVSHGCTQGAVDSHTSTEIHKAGGHDPVTGALDLGSSVHDSATIAVDNNVPIPANSTVKFTFYKGGCDGTVVESSGNLDATSGSIDPALPEGPLGAGSYAYRAVFTSGNTNVVKNSTSDCEPMTINKAQLHISTTIHDASHGAVTSVALASVVHDTATVTGDVAGFPIGAVSFTLNGAHVDNDPAADGTATARSVDSVPLEAGAYTYAASVAGNDNYLGATSDDEPLEVKKGDTNTVTQVHDSSHHDITGKSVPLGSFVHDSATVSFAGGTPPFPILGGVTYILHSGDCTGAVISSETVAVGNESSATQITVAGAYAYEVKYNGNGNYNPSNAACEPFSVAPQLGKTMGFWGNNNGTAFITGHGGYLANSLTIGRGAVVDTSAESLKILPNQLNACGKGTPFIFTAGAQTAAADCTLATGVNKGTLNTASAQTLALGYNIKLVTAANGFQGNYSANTIGTLGCTPVGSLSTSSTVQQAFDYGVSLINGSAAGGTTTQAQLGAWNTLAGCLNREA